MRKFVTITTHIDDKLVVAGDYTKANPFSDCNEQDEFEIESVELNGQVITEYNEDEINILACDLLRFGEDEIRLNKEDSDNLCLPITESIFETLSNIFKPDYL